MFDKSKLDEVLNLTTEIIKNVFGEKLCDIFLFGSYARGDFDEESDIDIFVLVDLNDIDLSKYINVITDATFDINLEYNVLLSIILKDKKQFEYWKNTVPFYINILREGVKLSA